MAAIAGEVTLFRAVIARAFHDALKLQCVNCGFNKNINGLELDHIEGGGSKRRKELGADGGWNYMVKLKKLNFPSGYQVLCATCNKIKQIEIDPK